MMFLLLTDCKMRMLKRQTFYEYTVSLQEHPLIKKSKLDVEIVTTTYKSHPDERYDNKKSFTVAAINIENTDKAQEKANGIFKSNFQFTNHRGSNGLTTKMKFCMH